MLCLQCCAPFPSVTRPVEMEMEHLFMKVRQLPLLLMLPIIFFSQGCTQKFDLITLASIPMNEGTVTCAADEWQYVMCGKELDYMSDYNTKAKNAPRTRILVDNTNPSPPVVTTCCGGGGSSSSSSSTTLTKPEIVGLALYTGPMVRRSNNPYVLISLTWQYMVYNAILRHQSMSRSAAQGGATGAYAKKRRAQAKKQVELAEHFIAVSGNVIQPKLPHAQSRRSSIYSTTEATSRWAMYKSAEMLKLMVFDKIDVDGDLHISRKELGQHIYWLMKSGTLTSA